MTLDDITGVGRCLGRGQHIDITDMRLFRLVNDEFPGSWDLFRRHRNPGETLLVPKWIEFPRERAMRLDDGVMTIWELKTLADCAYGTAQAARVERSRGD